MVEAHCNIVKLNDARYAFCPPCFKEYTQLIPDFIQPDRSKREELIASLDIALKSFHDEMVNKNCPIKRESFMGAAYVMVHVGVYISCSICKEIKSMRYSEHDGNIVREVQ